MTKPKAFTKEFEAEAVRLARTSGQTPHWLCSKLSHDNPNQKMGPTARGANFSQILVRSTKVGRAAENVTQEVPRCSAS